MHSYLEIGRIASTHGLGGELNLDLWCDGPDFVRQFPTLYLGDELRPFAVLSCRPHGFQVILKTDLCDSVDTAKTLVGQVVFFARADARLPEGTFFEDDLIGLRVVDETTGAEYGTLKAVYRTGANDVYSLTDAAGKEKLFPAISQVVRKTDPANGVMLITPLAGLFDDEN